MGPFFDGLAIKETDAIRLSLRKMQRGRKSCWRSDHYPVCLPCSLMLMNVDGFHIGGAS